MLGNIRQFVRTELVVLLAKRKDIEGDAAGNVNFYCCDRSRLLTLKRSLLEINLKFMQNLRLLYQLPVGFSDHTTDLLASKTAISLGANIIERHFTLNKTMEGPDHLLSSHKEEMFNLVKFI